MAKGSHRLGSKNFFTLVVLSVSALAVMTFTFASQQKTSTQSDAAGSCSKIPTLTAMGVDAGRNSVVYTYRVKNNNPTSCKKAIRYGLYVSKKPSASWHIDYKLNDAKEWSSDLYSTGLLKSGKSDIQKIRVEAPPKAESKTHNLQISACEAFGLDGGGAAVNDNCVTKSFKYTKD